MSEDHQKLRGVSPCDPQSSSERDAGVDRAHSLRGSQPPNPASDGPRASCPPLRPSGVANLALWAQRLLMLLLAFAARVTTLTAQGLWRDEVDQWRFAFQSMDELIANFTRPGWNGPLYSPILRIWITLTGESAFAMRLLSVMWGVLTVSLVVVLAHRITRDRRIAAVAGVLVAFSPYLIWYAQEIKMYTWVPMLVLLALYALERACRQPRLTWWGIVLVATTLAVYSHILAALLIPVLVIWFLLIPARGARAWGGGLLVLAGLTLPYVPLLSWQAPLALIDRQTGYPDYSLGEMLSTLLNGWSVGISQGAWGLPSVTLGAMIVLGILACVGIVSAGLFCLSERRRGAPLHVRAPSHVRARSSIEMRPILRLLVWCGLPLLVVWGVSLRGPIFTDRYLIWSAPAFYILVSIGVVTVSRLWRPQGILLLAAILTLNGHSWLAQATVPLKPEFEPAVRLVETQREARDVLLFQIPYNHHVFDYYATDGLGDWAEAPFTNWRESDGSYKVGADYVSREMRRLVAGYDRVWLIASEVALWDERDLVKQWLSDTYVPVSVDDFTGVSVWLFERPDR